MFSPSRKVPYTGISCAAAAALAEDYDGRVQVVDNKRISLTQLQSVLDAKRLVKRGLTAAQVKAQLEQHALDASIYITCSDLKYLKKGGRITPAAAAIGTVLNIKPVLTIENGEILLVGKARGSRQGNNLLVEKIHACGGIDFSLPILLGYTGLTDVFLKKYVEDSRALWENGTDRLDSTLIGGVIGTHAGPGAVAVAFFRKK